MVKNSNGTQKWHNTTFQEVEFLQKHNAIKSNLGVLIPNMVLLHK